MTYNLIVRLLMGTHLRYFLHTAVMIAIVVLLALGLHLTIDALDPVPVRVGMTWKETREQFESAHLPLSKSSFQEIIPYDQQTFIPEYASDYYMTSLAEDRHLSIYIRAEPYNSALTREQQDWQLQGLSIGPVGSARLDKFERMKIDYTPVDQINLATYHPRRFVLLAAALIAIFVIIWRALPRPAPEGGAES